MYSSGYSHVSKYSTQAQKKMQYHSKGKSCGYYMRIVFFFSSLIQSLIIVSLVLFLIYGKNQDSVSTSGIQDLEESFSRLSIENVALRQQRKNLTTLLNATLTEKARNDWDLAKLRYFSNISAVIIQDIDKRVQQCNGELLICKSRALLSGSCPQFQFDSCNCGMLVEQMKARLGLVESNFTEKTQRMRREIDQIAKDRDDLNLQVISLRRNKLTHEKEVEFCRQQCKDDFAISLSGVSNVTSAFLKKVDSLFPSHIAFQLTCPKQREHLEQIRSNCSSLSKEVEDKFQHYLNIVGTQVSNIQAESNRLKAENWRLSEDYRWCSQNRTGLIQQNRQNLDRLQQKHDQGMERVLMDKINLKGEIKVLDSSDNFKSKEIAYLKEQLKDLNMSCMSKAAIGGFAGGSRTSTGQTGLNLFGGGSSSASSSSSSGGHFGRTGSGLNSGLPGSTFNKQGSTGLSSSTGSVYNKPGSTGLSSSTGSVYNKPGSTGLSSSTGSVYNKPVSNGVGSSSPSLFSTGSSGSSGSGYSKPGSTGSNPILSSSGTGLNKPALTGKGSSTPVSSSGTTGLSPNLSSSGTGSNKPALTGKGSSTPVSSSGTTGLSPNLSSSGTGSNKPTANVKSTSSSSSTGSTTKTGSSSSGLSWFGFGSSSSTQSKSGSGTGKGPSSGNGYGGTGLSTGAGRTSGLGGGPVSVAQHLQDLQRLINPPGPEEKQDLSRMLG